MDAQQWEEMRIAALTLLSVTMAGMSFALSVLAIQLWPRLNRLLRVRIVGFAVFFAVAALRNMSQAIGLPVPFDTIVIAATSFVLIPTMIFMLVTWRQVFTEHIQQADLIRELRASVLNGNGHGAMERTTERIERLARELSGSAGAGERGQCDGTRDDAHGNRRRTNGARDHGQH